MATKFALLTSTRGKAAANDIALDDSFNFTGGLQISGSSAATEGYADTASSTAAQSESNLRTAASGLGASLDVNGEKITSLGTPTADDDAATKAYVDSVAAGLDPKASVKAASTTNLTLSNEQNIDGVPCGAGSRVLVKDQSTASQNGIYIVVDGGAWTRALDLPSGADAAGVFVFVEGGGTTNEGKGFVCVSDTGSAVVGTDALSFSQFSGGASYTAGNGIEITGASIAAKLATGSALSADGNGLIVDAASDSQRGTLSPDDFVKLAVYEFGGFTTQSTTDATPWSFSLSTLPINKLRMLNVTIMARSSSDATKSCVRRMMFVARRGGSGNSTEVGSAVEMVNIVDSGGIGAISVAYTVGTDGADSLTFTGIAATNISWRVSAEAEIL